MSDDRFIRAKEIFQRVSELPTEERAEAIRREAAGDELLSQEVAQLLAHDLETEVGLGPLAEVVRADIRRIGPYRILDMVDHGGMGVVYRAVREDDKFRKRVAIKMLKRGHDSAELLRRFRMEQQLQGILSHPNVAQIFDAGETEDHAPYFVMEFVDGVPIDRYCDANRLTIQDRLRLFQKVCDAVQHAHSNLIIHRDIKPANILVTADGDPKLLDFGIAKYVGNDYSPLSADPTIQGSYVMTPQYASPEQVGGLAVKAPSDVYSLGVLLYELLTGHRPYHLAGHARAEIERVVCHTEPEKPSVAVRRVEPVPEGTSSTADDGTGTLTPESVSRTRGGSPDHLRRVLLGDLDNIVLMAMRKEPTRRYTAVQQMRDDIERHLEGLPIVAGKATLPYRFSKFVRRNRVAVAAVAAVVLVLFVSTVVTTAALIRTRAAVVSETEARDAAEASRANAIVARDQSTDLVRDLMEPVRTMMRSSSGSVAELETIWNTFDQFTRQTTHDDDPDLAALRAEIGIAMADLMAGLTNPGRLDRDDAIEHFRSTLAQLESSLVIAPDDPSEREHLLDASRLKLARLLRTRRDDGDLEEAIPLLEACREFRLRGVEAAKTRDAIASYVEVLNELGSANTKLFELGSDTSAEAKADAYLTEAISRVVRMTEAAPNDAQVWRESMIPFQRLGYLRYVQGKNLEATTHNAKATECIWRALEIAPDRTGYVVDLATCSLYEANVLIASGDFATATARLQEAVERLDGVTIEGDSRIWKYRMIARMVLAEVSLSAGDATTAGQRLQEVERIATEHLAGVEDDTITAGQFDALRCLAGLDALAGDLESAMSRHAQIDELAADRPDDPAATRQHIGARLDRIRLRLRFGGSFLDSSNDLKEARDALTSLGADPRLAARLDAAELGLRLAEASPNVDDVRDLSDRLDGADTDFDAWDDVVRARASAILGQTDRAIEHLRTARTLIGDSRNPLDAPVREDIETLLAELEG